MVSYPSLTITTTKFVISQSKAVATVLITHEGVADLFSPQYHSWYHGHLAKFGYSE